MLLTNVATLAPLLAASDEHVEMVAVEDLSTLVTVTAIVLVVAVAAVRLSARTGLPSLLLYLLLGVALGEAGLGVAYEDIETSLVLGYLALVLILAEGGLTTSWSDIKPSIAPAVLLATVGVVVSVAVVGAAGHFLLGLSWEVALLLAAIVSSTDAAAVFSVLRDVRPKARLAGILEAESGFNDAPVVLIVVALAERLTEGVDNTPLVLLPVLVLAELIGGVLVGLTVGFVGAWVMRQLGAAASGLFPIGVMAWIVLAYGVAQLVHSSGFIAVYLAALVLGNVAMPHRATTRSFAQGLGWLAQIGLFVMLGLLASPSELPGQIVPALVLGAVLLLVARPLSVAASTLWFRMPVRDQIFLSWSGLRGAVPIVLAIVPIVLGAQNLQWIFNLVFVLVVVFTLVQAPTMPMLARRLGVIDTEHARTLDIESTTLEELGADMLEITIGEGSRLHGVEIFELRLPVGADISLVVRDTGPFVPTPQTELRHGDQLLLVVPVGLRETAEARLHAVDRAGRLAGWGSDEG
ncbi:cell volume regulation protein A [Kineosphaera limosa]|uniref:Putative sodium/proton antiporter n=1 Tax=Kineosphaera limosa NBRC 100340 TaxID=1184609 RepID=K6WG11_9MICO|nr:potassium/proton antiporter [Kineosphaera limosa]NYE02023.1 cell volume regulation protein A [Kineosphaera limosa]GAB98220.1 putative sodium/proton antiporter [Kineosphaera limosa NBRC 100340]